MSWSGKILIALFLIALMGLFSSDAQSEEGRWKEVGKSRTDTKWYIDATSASRTSGNSISVWVRSIPDKSDAKDNGGEGHAWRIMKEIQAKYFGTYEFTDGLWELDCSRGMFRVLYFVAYDKNGQIITSLLTPDAHWEFIIPESAGESLQKGLCK